MTYMQVGFVVFTFCLFMNILSIPREELPTLKLRTIPVVGAYCMLLGLAWPMTVVLLGIEIAANAAKKSF